MGTGCQAINREVLGGRRQPAPHVLETRTLEHFSPPLLPSASAAAQFKLPEPCTALSAPLQPWPVVGAAPGAGLGPDTSTLRRFSPVWFGSSLPQYLPKAGAHLSTCRYLWGDTSLPAGPEPTQAPWAPNKRFTLPHVLVGLSTVKSVSQKLVLLMLLISLSSACQLKQLWPGAAKLAQGAPHSREVLGCVRGVPAQWCCCWGDRVSVAAEPGLFYSPPISAVSSLPEGSG